MNDLPLDAARAHSFAGIADAYDRARPSYPREAVEWLSGSKPCRVLELGAGTGKLTDTLLELGHDVLATDPLDEMLSYLRLRRPECRTAVAPAEAIPSPAGSVDVVVSAQAFHWFDLDKALPEIARVLTPAGVVALVWNERDERIPWVRKLGRLIDTPMQLRDPSDELAGSRLFEEVEQRDFRFWQPLRKPELHDLVRSRSNIATMPEAERAEVLGAVDQLYDDYGRGPDGLILPYITRCFRAVVRPVVSAQTGADQLDLEATQAMDLSGAGKRRDDEDGTPLFSLS